MANFSGMETASSLTQVGVSTAVSWHVFGFTGVGTAVATAATTPTKTTGQLWPR